MERKTFKELAHRIDDLAPRIRHAGAASVHRESKVRDAAEARLNDLWREVEETQRAMLIRSPTDLQELYAQMCIYMTDLIQGVLPEWVEQDDDPAARAQRKATAERYSTAMASALDRLAAWGFQFPSREYAELHGVHTLKPAPLLT